MIDAHQGRFRMLCYVHDINLWFNISLCGWQLVLLENTFAWLKINQIYSICECTAIIEFSNSKFSNNIFWRLIMRCHSCVYSSSNCATCDHSLCLLVQCNIGSGHYLFPSAILPSQGMAEFIELILTFNTILRTYQNWKRRRVEYLKNPIISQPLLRKVECKSYGGGINFVPSGCLFFLH